MIFRQEMTSYLDGGSGYSSQRYNILDGHRIIATRRVITDGFPTFNILSEKVHIGDKTFDRLKEDANKQKPWIIKNRSDC